MIVLLVLKMCTIERKDILYKGFNKTRMKKIERLNIN